MVGKSIIENVIIVESSNDEAFVRAYINFLKENDTTEVKTDIDMEVKTLYEYLGFEPLGGLDKDSLTKRLKEIYSQLDKGKYEKIKRIGILLDADKNIPEKTEWITAALLEIFGATISNIVPNQLYAFGTKVNDSFINLEVACYFINLGGEGELENVMKEIANQPSYYADCLEAWKKCYSEKEMPKTHNISEKEMVKLWVDFYKRFDTLKRNDRDKDNTDFINTMLGYKDSKGKDIPPRPLFDFEHTALDELKAFLQLFP